MHDRLSRYTPPTTQPYQEIVPQQVVLVIDAFFWRRGDGVMVFRAANLKRNLLWFPVASENVNHYLYGVGLLQQAGWQVTGFTVDGRKGVITALESIAPVQYCQFHQKQTVRQYLTKRPKHQAAQELKVIADLLAVTDRQSFETWLQAWYDQQQDLLKERTYHESGKWSYTHRRLRSTYFSLKHHLPWLFTYHEHAQLPNTTNTLDGSISHLRTLHRVHRGAQLRRKHNLTDTFLRG